MSENNKKTTKKPSFSEKDAGKLFDKIIVEAAESETVTTTPNHARRRQSASRTRRASSQGQTANNEKKASSATEAAGSEKTAAKPRTRRGGGRTHKVARKPTVRIIPLGGVGEIGKNCTVYECGDDMVIIDCGLAFPDEDMLGVDLVIPDFSYILKNQDKVRGIFITHGHEDHIGSLAFLLKQVNIPVYATKLTIGLIQGKLKEHGLSSKVQLNVVKAGQVIKAGCMSVEFINVNHSIPDACGFAINTPAGVIIQTGDFKVDYTPIQGEVIDLARFGELGSKGVLALLPDSTNADAPGSCASERSVGRSFEFLFQRAINKRIIVATFASNIDRLQQIIHYAHRFGRKVAVSGRSMENNVEKAQELGYLDIPKDTLINIDMIRNYADNQLVIITTGSQGEPMSALARMATGDHRKLSVTPNDLIIFSARPVPGNEKLVNRVVNELLKLGAEVIYEKAYQVHVSGHGFQDEMRLMMSLTRPKFVIPVHGEFKHLKAQRHIATSLGIPFENVFLPTIGIPIETDGVEMKYGEPVVAGRVLVDGLGVGDVGSIVLRDRKHLAEDGLIVIVATIDSETGKVVSGPDIISRGFVYVREAEEMMKEVRMIASSSLENCGVNGVREWGNLKHKVKEEVSRYVFNKTKRNPMILPVIQEI